MKGQGKMQIPLLTLWFDQVLSFYAHMVSFLIFTSGFKKQNILATSNAKCKYVHTLMINPLHRLKPNT